MKISCKIILSSALFAIFNSAFAVDTIYYNGQILTMNKEAAVANAVAVDGDKIVAVGEEEDVMENATSDTQMVNLSGRTVLP